MTPQPPARGVHAPRNLVRRSATFLVAAVLVGGVPLVARGTHRGAGPGRVGRAGRGSAFAAPALVRSASRPASAIPDLGADLARSPGTGRRRSGARTGRRGDGTAGARRDTRACAHPDLRRASGPPCASANRAATTRSRVGPGSTAARTSSIVRRGTRSPRATRRCSSVSTRRRLRPPIRTHWPSPCTPSVAPARGRTAAVTWIERTTTPQPTPPHQLGDTPRS